MTDSHPGALGGVITVLGVGNPIMGDDGVGIELLRAVNQACADPRVEFVDGGISGMELLGTVQDAAKLLILDAVSGSTPGTVVELAGDQITRLVSSKLSPHQVGLLDVFGAARLTGQEPADVCVVGIVPESVDLGVGLSVVVASSLPEATTRATEVIGRWLNEIDGAQQ